MAIKVGFEHLKTTVANYELRTPVRVNGNETSSMSTVYLSTYTIVMWSFSQISGIFGFLRSAAEINFPEFWKKGWHHEVEKFDEESF